MIGVMRYLRCLAGLPLLLLWGCAERRNMSLFQAAEAGDTPAIEAAVSCSADVNQKNESGLTALILAARAGKALPVETLVRHRADPNLRGGVNDWTPLMHAIHRNQTGTARALLEAGADVSLRGRNGETALMMAAGYGYTPIVELLLERGANPWAQTPDGRTVFSVAVAGVADIDRFTLASCQSSTVQALKRKDPTLHLPDNLWGRAAKVMAAVAKLRGCIY